MNDWTKYTFAIKTYFTPLHLISRNRKKKQCISNPTAVKVTVAKMPVLIPHEIRVFSFLSP